jgi:hypothetical protein
LGDRRMDQADGRSPAAGPRSVGARPEHGGSLATTR